MIMTLECLLIFIALFTVKCDEFCSVDDRNCGVVSEDNKYSIDANENYLKFYENIQNAEQNNVECNATKLQCYKNVIARDLGTFKENGISEKLIEEAKLRGTHYQIIDHELYRDESCMFPSRCSGIEYFILKVINKLPNMDLIINTRDYPQSSERYGPAIPVFSFSKTKQYYDIMYPAWSFWEGGPAISLYPRGLGRWDQHRDSLNRARKEYPWLEKIQQAFFRGSRTSLERDNLVLLSRKKPDLVDAQYTKNQAWKSDVDTLHATPVKEISLESHCKYKYLFNYRGVAASFRHKHLFLCGSLIFHVGDEWNEFYYDAMKPWIHYIPVPKDATQSQIEELILFAKHNDDLVKKIADRGRDFVWEKLRMKDITSYWKILLTNYAKLLNYKVTLKTELIKIEQR